MGYPSTDFARHDTRQMKIDAALQAEQENTDVSDEDRVNALDLEKFDASDLVTVCFNNPNPMGSNKWFMDVLNQCQIDRDGQIEDIATDIKNDRVAREYDPTGE